MPAHSVRLQRKGKSRPAGRPGVKSGLPAPVPGQPFSLLGTLRRTESLLSVADAAELLGRSKKAVYAAINKGKIPVASIPGIDGKHVDPAAWALVLEHDNPHLKPSSRKYLEACA